MQKRDTMNVSIHQRILKLKQRPAMKNLSLLGVNQVRASLMAIRTGTLSLNTVNPETEE